MNNFPLAFIMGLLGSLHCAVMCGPLMLSMPLQKTSYFKSALQLLSYQLGRVLVYTLLGLLLGWVGSSLRMATNQETLSLVIGILLVLFTIVHWSGRYSNRFNAIPSKLIAPISKLMGKILGLPCWGFLAGMLNGLLPCGMVYLALATALNSSAVQYGGLFMLLFGLGTTPLMLMISLGGIYLKKYIRFNTQKLIPWFMLFMGTLFILRASALGIPFLSPSSHTHLKAGVEVCQ